MLFLNPVRQKIHLFHLLYIRAMQLCRIESPLAHPLTAEVHRTAIKEKVERWETTNFKVGGSEIFGHL
jgi:hypothetical protein